MLVLFLLIGSVQFSRSVVSLCNPMNHSTPGLPVHHQLPEFTQTQVHRVSDAIQPSHPLSSPSPPALNLSQRQGLFKWVISWHQVAKVLEFQLQHQSFQWTPRTVSFRMDWLDLLAVQGTLKSLLQHHSSKASILWHSAFFIEKMLTSIPPKITVQASGTGNGFRMTLSSLAHIGILFSVPCHFFLPSALLQVPLTYLTLGLQGRLKNWGRGGY